MYMPKPSESKKAELEAAQAKIRTIAREPKPHSNYLEFVRQENAKHPRKLPNVSSLPTLQTVD